MIQFNNSPRLIRSRAVDAVLGGPLEGKLWNIYVHDEGWIFQTFLLYMPSVRTFPSATSGFVGFSCF